MAACGTARIATTGERAHPRARPPHAPAVAVVAFAATCVALAAVTVVAAVVVDAVAVAAKLGDRATSVAEVAVEAAAIAEAGRVAQARTEADHAAEADRTLGAAPGEEGSATDVVRSARVVAGPRVRGQDPDRHDARDTARHRGQDLDQGQGRLDTQAALGELGDGVVKMTKLQIFNCLIRV